MRDHWNEIYHALSKNKSRTFITMIGVAWGMFLFIWLLGMVNGMHNGFDRDMKGASTNSFFLWANKTNEPYKGYGRGRSYDLTVGDVEALKRQFKEIQQITPRNQNNARVRFRSKTGNYQIFGDYPEQNEMFKKHIIYGRFVNQEDMKYLKKVAIVGEDILKDLFDMESSEAIGQSIVINSMNFTVVGVYENLGSFEGGASIFIPFTTFSKIYHQGEKVQWIAVNIKDHIDIKETEERFKQFLKARHDIAPNDTQAIGGFNLGEMFGKLFRFMTGLEFLTAVVGFLTLFAGAIAVSSILLITVKERTKEFGIRRALGAKPKQIIQQILVEALVVTMISGIVGIILGTLLLAVINTAVEQMNDSKIPLVNCSVNIEIIGIAFLIILLLALLSGLLPAWRAIQIKPIDALREE